MITKNDLYDIAYAWTLIRNEVTYDLNYTIISRIEQTLRSDASNCELNQIRIAIASIPDLDSQKWGYVYHNNVYVYCQVIRDKLIIELLINLCILINQLIKECKNEQVYDLLDCCHCLPYIIADNNLLIPSSYWKNNIRQYRQKWDKNFLKEEEDKLKKFV